jgi:protein-disulfide isomerase
VEGTPTIFLEDGRIIPGYQSAENIIAFINK